jgi:N utilization substance protein B
MEGFDYQTSLESIVDNFNRGFDLQIPLDSEVFSVAHSVIEARDTLDEVIKPLLANWRFERIGDCTKLILRLAIWELLNTQTPPTIVINEAIELAKCFAEKDAYKFVNGLLDKLVKNRTT